MARKKSWLTSEGRKLLLQDLRHGAITPDMDYETVFEMRTEYEVGESREEAKRLFENRLKSAREILRQKDVRAAQELALLKEDRKVKPAPKFNHRGEPRWEGSDAQKQLKKDVSEGKHLKMKPKEFKDSNHVYKEFGLDTIRGHITQEERLLKFLKQYRGRHGY